MDSYQGMDIHMNELPEDAIVDGNVEDSWKRSALNRAAKQASKHTGSQPSAVSLSLSRFRYHQRIDYH
jgi:hypothetical protein